MMTLESIDPDHASDDLEPLADLIGSARVVGIGESAHYVREYAALRHRLTRFLVERLGFTVVAMESGFSEGLLIDRWIRGGEGVVDDIASRGLTYRFGNSRAIRRLLSWMREAGVTYSGIDLPGDLANPAVALASLRDYLRRADPGATELLDLIETIVSKFAGPHTIPALSAYRELTTMDRDELTSSLSGLAARFDTFKPFYLRAEEPGDVTDYATARHELRMVILLDQMLRTQTSGEPRSIGVNVRDRGMAESTLRLLDRGRVVLLAANTHLQRIPIRIDGVGDIPTLGTYLSGELRRDYLAMAMTCVGGRVTVPCPDSDDPRGVSLLEVGLPARESDCVEKLFGDDPAILDVRNFGGPASIRQRDGYASMPIRDAYDLVASVPVSTPEVTS